MLVIKRQRDQRVRLLCPDGTVIWVMVDHGVSLSFDAPNSVKIDREERLDLEPETTTLEDQQP